MSYLLGIVVYLLLRVILFGFYTVDQNERAVKTSFGRANRVAGMVTTEDPISDSLTDEEKKRYSFPIVQVIQPGLHFKFPWEKIYKTSIATETMNMAYDYEKPTANRNGEILDAVTQDQLNIGLKGQIRFRVSEKNLYAFFFGIKNPIIHVTGFFVSVLRQKIANYTSPVKSLNSENANEGGTHITDSVSVNDLRKNLREINDSMIEECESSASRYGIILDASLITGIEPPQEVESALAAINTAYNNVSSEISLAKASADQTIVLSRRAVEIETLKVQAEVEPLLALFHQLKALKANNPGVLKNFVRNVKVNTYQKAKRIILERQV